jgi:type I restriction enzyme S subunit
VSINCCFSKDDILFGKLRPNLRKSLKAPFAGYCSTDIIVLRARDGVLPKYAAHVFQWERVFAAASATAVGTKMPRTSWNELGRYRVFKTDSEIEQSRIAAVLDTVDEAIAKTEAVIAKLRQVRDGLLHDLLTRGLDQHGQLRDPIAHPEQFQDSPLGRIPREWDVTTLGNSIATTFDYRGRTPLKIGMAWGGGEIPALSAMNVEMGKINFEKETNFGSSALYDRWMTQGHTEKGDVLITMEAPLGNIAQIPDTNRYILSQRVVLLRPKQNKLTKDFLAIQMAGTRFQKELVKHSSGSTAVGIQRAKLELIDIAVPQSTNEQVAIALNINTADSQIVSVERELDKLKNLKSGLMTDLLTGRVRVPTHTLTK